MHHKMINNHYSAKHAEEVSLYKYTQVVTHPHTDTNETYFELNSAHSQRRGETAVFIQQEKETLIFHYVAEHLATLLIMWPRCQCPTGRDCQGGVIQKDGAGTRIGYSITPD